MGRTYSIGSLGCHAARSLTAGAEVRVAAVFATSVHLKVRLQGKDSGIVCVGGAGLGQGPLNALCRKMPEGGWLRCGLQPGQTSRIETTGLNFGDSARFIWTDALIWQPPIWPVVPDAAILRELLRGIADCASSLGLVPSEGLAQLAFGEPAASGLACVAMRKALLATATLGDWLAEALSATASGEAHHGDPELTHAARTATHGLLGLGDGLTPAGDDLLSGLLIGLHAGGAGPVAVQLGEFIREAPADATTDLSRAFLTAAIEGDPGETLAATITGILRGDKTEWPPLLRRIDAIGHTSGWDMLAGAVLALAAIAAD